MRRFLIHAGKAFLILPVPRAFGPAVNLVLAEPAVSGALAIDVGLDRPEYGEAVVQAQGATGKPVERA